MRRLEALNVAVELDEGRGRLVILQDGPRLGSSARIELTRDQVPSVRQWLYDAAEELRRYEERSTKKARVPTNGPGANVE